MLKLGRVTKVEVIFLLLFLILGYSDVFEFSAAILEKGPLQTKITTSYCIFCQSYLKMEKN